MSQLLLLLPRRWRSWLSACSLVLCLRFAPLGFANGVVDEIVGRSAFEGRILLAVLEATLVWLLGGLRCSILLDVRDLYKKTFPLSKTCVSSKLTSNEG